LVQQFGARVRAVIAAMSYYPVTDSERPDRVRTSVRLTPEQHDDVELMAKLWTEFDKALGQRRRKWSTMGVLERLVAVGIDGFWTQVGGRPPSKEGREDFVRRAVATLIKKKQ
jgi:hypothetical protein